MSEPTKFLLDEDAIPTHWVNLQGDLPGDPLPPLSPRTGQPAGPDDLTPIFPMGLIAQEVSAEPEIPIPAAVRDAYKLWRPTPLYRAHRLEAALGTKARIFYKYGGVGAPIAVRPHRGGTLPGRASDGLARHRDLRGGRGRRARPDVQLRARQR